MRRATVAAIHSAVRSVARCTRSFEVTAFRQQSRSPVKNWTYGVKPAKRRRRLRYGFCSETLNARLVTETRSLKG